MAKPTPTQEENDRAAMGEHVVDKEPDGSPEDPNVNPPDVHGKRAEEHSAEQHKRKTMQPGSSGAYQTRAATTPPRSTSGS